MTRAKKRKRPLTMRVTESERSVERLARVLAFENLDDEAKEETRERARQALRSLRDVGGW